MENQLINLSIQDLSIEDFDTSSLKQITIHLCIGSSTHLLNYPFSCSNLPLHSNSSLSLNFSYKSKIFASASIPLQFSLNAQKAFKIQGTGMQVLSPEKQRPLLESSQTELKTIGQASAVISLCQNSSSPPVFSEGIRENTCVAIESCLEVHDIALDLYSILQGHGEISVSQAEHFRVLITGLNFKLKTLAVIQKRLSEAEGQSREHLRGREDMERNAEETCREMDSLRNELGIEFKRVAGERNAMQEEMSRMEVVLRERNLKIDELESKNLEQESKIQQLKNENKNFVDMQNMINRMQKDFKALEAERDVFRQDFSNTIKIFQQEIINKDQEISNIAENNLQLENNLIEKAQEIHELLQKCDERQRKIDELNSETSRLQSIIKSLENLEQKSLQMEELSKSHQSECVSLHSSISQSCKDFSQKILLLNSEKSSLHDQNVKKTEDLQKVTQELQDRTTSYRAETLTSQDLRTKSVIIQQKLSNTVDMSKLFQQVKYLSTYASEVCDKMVEDNDTLCELSLGRAQDCMNLLRVIQQIRDIIEDRDSEINILRELIAELQNKTVYYPVKDDPVDEAIADYLNQRSEPLPVQFIREDYGCYLFGTKRVFIKLENNKITSNG